ncbi:MAG: 30S ribosomal protein S11 [Parcubacteria group bacterium]|nr:30S ribosomal protein S11 [Parcubacteria group bacterium]
MGKKRIIKKGETGAQAVSAAPETTVSGKQKFKEGRVHIYSSYNNTIMTLTDERGNVVLSVSAGRMGFRGTKKSTPFAASKVAEQLSQGAKLRGVERVAVFVRGVGSGRDSAVRSLGTKGLEISSITDLTPTPHNGPRPPKVRRV